MEIRSMSILEYHIVFAEYLTGLSMLFVKQAAANGFLYVAKNHGRYAGYICGSDELTTVRITHAFTIPEFRGQGVFTALVRYVLNTQNKPVRCVILSNHPCRSGVCHVLRKLGFQSAEKVTVFSCSCKDAEYWRRYMDEKGNRLCRTLKMQGYHAVSFRDMDKDLKEQLAFSDRTEYGNIFHPALHLEDPSKQLDWELSYAAVRDGRLSAYCLVTRADPKSAMFDQISVSAAEQGGGVILLPYSFAVDQVIWKNIENIFYAMYNSNKHAAAFRKKLFQIFPTTEQTAENYYYDKRNL